MRVAIVSLLLAAVLVAVLADIPRRSYVASFGSNEAERLGRGDNSLRPSVKLNCPKQRCFVRSLVAANSFAVLSTGRGDYGWGSNVRGQLPGVTLMTENIPPTELGDLTPTGLGAFVLLNDACLVVAGNDTYGYGSNDQGQLSILGWGGPSSGPSLPSPPTLSAPTPILPPVTVGPPSPAPTPLPFRRESEISETFEFSEDIPLPPWLTGNELFPSSIVPKSISCADTRCYYRNASSPFWWGYWGAADYDPIYNFVTEPVHIVPNSKRFTAVVHSRTTAIFATIGSRDFSATGKFLNAGSSSVNEPLATLTLACDVDYLPGVITKNLKNNTLGIDVGYGFVFYVCDDLKTIYSFGNNSNGQLGNPAVTSAYIPGIPSAPTAQQGHSKVSLVLDTDDYIVDLAAGMATSYILTRAGHVYGWGYTGSQALGGDESLIPNVILASHTLFIPTLLSYYQSVQDVYQAVAIRSTSSAHGVFIGLAMRPGGENACPTLPSVISSLIDIYDNETLFCDIEGYYNFAELAMGATSTMSMNVYMKLRGDMQMSGSSSMQSNIGMEMEGDMKFFDSASARITGAGILEGSLGIFNQSKLQLSNANVSIAGDVTVDKGATVTFSSFSDALLSESNDPIVNVSGSTVVDGVVSVMITTAELDTIMQSLFGRERSENEVKISEKYENEGEFNLNLRADEPDSPISPPESQGASNVTATVILLSSEGGLTPGATFSTGLTLNQPSDPCSKASAEFQPSSSSLALILTISSNPGCTPDGKPATPNAKSTLGGSSKTTGIIVGSVVGGVVLLVLIAAIIILTVPTIRNAVLPYRGTSGKI